MSVPFNKMLDSLYEELSSQNSNNNLRLPEPKINKKPTRLDWNNINEFLKIINRSQDHFISFLKNDRKILSTFKDKTLMIQGKYNKNDIIKIMTEYVNKYSLCPICSSYDTILSKDMTIRKEKINCNKCKSSNYCS